MQQGKLVDVLPGWAPKGKVVHALFLSRRGVLPAFRQLLDYLTQHIEQA